MTSTKDKAGAGRCFKTGVWGSIIAAICCFTPILVIGLGAIGFAAFTPYLDLVLFPALAFFLVLAGYGFWRKKGSSLVHNEARRS